MYIRNDAQLLNVLSNISKEVVYKVSDEMLKALIGDIWQYTYDPLPNVYYYNKSGMPTFQFMEAFRLRRIRRQLNEIVTGIYYDWQSMDYDPNTFLHGSPYHGDMRKRLADILNVEGMTGFSTKYRRPYWDIFIREMFDNGGLEKLFDRYTKEEFAKFGIAILRA